MTRASLADREATRLAQASCLIVGIGSPHGDDQAGWAAIDHLQALQAKHIDLRKAIVPHDLLDWLSGVTVLHIIDSCFCELVNLGIQRFALQNELSSNESPLRWIPLEQNSSGILTTPERPLKLRSTGSHQIDVLTVLELAACLDRLPAQVVLWVIHGHRYNAGDAMSEGCQTALRHCIAIITEELYDA